MQGMCGLQDDDKLTWKCMGLIWFARAPSYRNSGLLGLGFRV